MSAFPPSVELVTLYEHVSSRGTRYMLGRLGSARIVVLPGDAMPDGTATWRVLIQERRESAAPTIANDKAAPQPKPSRAPRRRPHPRLAADHPANAEPLNDPVDDLWREGER
jgi:hypothetical protein